MVVQNRRLALLDRVPGNSQGLARHRQVLHRRPARILGERRRTVVRHPGRDEVGLLDVEGRGASRVGSRAGIRDRDRVRDRVERVADGRAGVLADRKGRLGDRHGGGRGRAHGPDFAAGPVQRGGIAGGIKRAVDHRQLHLRAPTAVEHILETGGDKMGADLLVIIVVRRR